MTAETLAEETKIGLRTIGRAEGEDGPVRLTAANAERLVEALESHGIEFISEEQRVGVCLERSRGRVALSSDSNPYGACK